ncbi:hypothetical protein [Thiohalorhabdus sp.]|uniref:hypothetical protein n=1 Tax=Thiohalorhabdus sp. TaxID=3094134 RepID=UPI002FC2E68B
MNLVTTWLEIEKGAGKGITHAAEDLSAATGLYADTSAIRKWESGKRRVPPLAMGHMLERSLYEVLRQEGVSIGRPAANQAARRLSPPG